MAVSEQGSLPQRTQRPARHRGPLGDRVRTRHGARSGPVVDQPSSRSGHAPHRAHDHRRRPTARRGETVTRVFVDPGVLFLDAPPDRQRQVSPAVEGAIDNLAEAGHQVVVLGALPDELVGRPSVISADVPVGPSRLARHRRPTGLRAGSASRPSNDPRRAERWCRASDGAVRRAGPRSPGGRPRHPGGRGHGSREGLTLTSPSQHVCKVGGRLLRTAREAASVTLCPVGRPPPSTRPASEVDARVAPGSIFAYRKTRPHGRVFRISVRQRWSRTLRHGDAGPCGRALRAAEREPPPRPACPGVASERRRRRRRARLGRSNRRGRRR